MKIQEIVVNGKATPGSKATYDVPQQCQSINVNVKTASKLTTEVQYRPNIATIEVTDAEQNVIESGSDVVSETQLTATAKIDIHYEDCVEVKEILKNDVRVSTSNHFSFTMPKEDTKIVMRYKFTKKMIVINQTENCNLTVSKDGTIVQSGDKVPVRSTLTLQATTDDQHTIDYFVVNNVKITATDGTATYTVLQNNSIKLQVEAHACLKEQATERNFETTCILLPGKINILINNGIKKVNAGDTVPIVSHAIEENTIIDSVTVDGIDFQNTDKANPFIVNAQIDKSYNENIKVTYSTSQSN